MAEQQPQPEEGKGPSTDQGWPGHVEDLYRLVTERASDLVFMLDSEARIRYASPSVTRMLGRDPSRLLDRHLLDHVHVEDRDVVHQAWSRAKEGATAALLLRLATTDGELRWLEGSACPTTFAGQTHVLAVCSDVTERQNAMNELKRSEGYLEQAQRLSRAGSWAWNVETRQFVHWSKGHYDLHGFDSALGPPSWEAAQETIHPDDRASCLEKIDRAVAMKTTCQMEYRTVLPDGGLRHIYSWAQPVFDSRGHLVEFVGTEMDITERKRLEEQFLQAQKMEAIGQLAGGVAHDFNNLLTIILGHSELLLHEVSPGAPLRDLVEGINDAGNRARGLTQRLLGFSRKTVVDPRLLDLNDVVRENEKLLRRLIGEDVRLAVHTDRDVPPIKVDPVQVGQILMNLTLNARDALPGGGLIAISTSGVVLDAEQAAALDPAAKAGRYARLTVRDNGTGMTPEVQARAFEPFFTTKAPGKGTGLGLAMVYGSVKQSDGFIRTESRPGRGATFDLLFPAAPGEAVRQTAPAERAAAAPSEETILVVEDEPYVRAMMCSVLREAGHVVLQAADSSEALRVAAEHPSPLHLVISDVIMPGMSGPRMVEQLIVIRPEIKVLYVSGYADDAVVQRGVLTADAAFLQKPFSMAALKDKIREILR
jgi:two-component system cell cycle sensor histidine kinase/response regulator CckA